MTAFVLVPGECTGGWVWRETAARLREAGAQVHEATLTGLGDRRHLAGPDTDLDTHIEDLVQLLDHVDEPEAVLVAHGTGAFPALGAADRRAGRVARIVYVDSGLPGDGESVLGQMPDPAARERLLARAGQDRLVPAPPPGGWQAWGSTAGLSEEALSRLSRLAAPQPLGALTRPLELTGAAGRLPVTGVLCTANGSSIAMVEAAAAMGDPRLRALADPRVSFFELRTGHWPMLSCPGELAEVLLRAAAGEGHRIAPAPGPPAHLRPFLLDAPEVPRERRGRVDLHLPDAAGPRPAVLFVHGGPVPADARPGPRDWPALVGYARYTAGLGAVGATVHHRLHGLADFGRAAEDVAAAVELVRADPRVDGDRVALWFFSAGGLLSADWLAAPPPWLRCVAATYPVLAPPPAWGLGESRFRPAAAVRGAGALPVVLTRVGLEHAEIAVTVEEFLAAAGECGAGVEVVDLPGGTHGFETTDHSPQAREAVARAVRSVLAHLRG